MLQGSSSVGVPELMRTFDETSVASVHVPPVPTRYSRWAAALRAAALSFCAPIRTMRFVSSAQVSDVELSAPIWVQVSGSAESSWKKPQVKSVTFGVATIYPASLA